MTDLPNLGLSRFYSQMPRSLTNMQVAIKILLYLHCQSLKKKSRKGNLNAVDRESDTEEIEVAAAMEEPHISQTTEEATDTTIPQVQGNITAEADQERSDQKDNHQAQKTAVTRRSRANTSHTQQIFHRPIPDTLLKMKRSTRRKPRRASTSEIDLKLLVAILIL